MELDPKHVAGLIDWTYAIIDDPSRDLAEREQLLQRNLSTDPAFQSRVLWAYANLLERVGRINEARSYYLHREELPGDLGWPPHFDSIELLAALGEIGAARHEFARLEAARPTEEERFVIEFLYGDPAVAKELSKDERYVRRLQPLERRCVDAVLDAKLRRVQLGVEEIDAVCPAHFTPPGFNREREEFYADFGHVDAAYRRMELDWHWYANFSYQWHLFLPDMRALRADSRFMPFAARVGLVDYWLKTDRWPDFCTRETLPYDCKEAAIAAQAKNHSNAAST